MFPHQDKIVLLHDNIVNVGMTFEVITYHGRRGCSSHVNWSIGVDDFEFGNKVPKQIDI